jgi:hypothetical protein
VSSDPNFTVGYGIGGMLDGVTLQGTLDLSQPNASMIIKDGITLTGANGTGPGTIDLTGTQSSLTQSSLFVQGVETLDNAVINIASGTLYSDIRNGDSILTLGPNLTINQTGGPRSVLASFSAGFSPGTINSSSITAKSEIINAGTINAGFSGGQFFIDPENFVNQGTIHASNGDAVGIGALSSVNFTNSGRLWADGGSITVGDVAGDTPVVGTGIDEISGAGIISFSSNAVVSGQGQSVIFDPNSTGTFSLIDSPDFKGTVAGLAPGNFLDLNDISYLTVQTPIYTPNANGTGGTLTVTDGQRTANIALLGQYMAGSFATHRDANAGVLVYDPPPSTQPPAVTPPHP